MWYNEVPWGTNFGILKLRGGGEKKGKKSKDSWSGIPFPLIICAGRSAQIVLAKRGVLKCIHPQYILTLYEMPRRLTIPHIQGRKKSNESNHLPFDSTNLPPFVLLEANKIPPKISTTWSLTVLNFWEYFSENIATAITCQIQHLPLSPILLYAPLITNRGLEGWLCEIIWVILPLSSLPQDGSTHWLQRSEI